MKFSDSKLEKASPNNGIKPLSTIAKRGRRHFNLWIFDSIKNNRRLTIGGDLRFMFCVLLEGDTSCSGYIIPTTPCEDTALDRPSESQPDLIVKRTSDVDEWWHIRHSHAASKRYANEHNPIADAARHAGAVYIERSDKDVAHRGIAFDNWLLLCAAMTRAVPYPAHREISLLTRRIETGHPLTVRELLEQEGIDRALMIATIARLLQAGRLQCDLEGKLFSEESILRKQK